MSYLPKHILLKRDEKGDLLPTDVQFEANGVSGLVKVLPMQLGEIESWSELLKGEDRPEQITQTVSLLKQHLVEPSLSEKEWKEMPYEHALALLNSLLQASGVDKKKAAPAGNT